MNSAAISKSFLILKNFKKQSVKLSTTQYYLAGFHNNNNNSRATKNSSTTSTKSVPSQSKYSKSKKTENFTSLESDSTFSKFVSSEVNDPDTFGTLSNDWKLQKKLDELPDEEDDVVETEFLHNRQGKTRLSINQYAWIIKRFLSQKKVGHAIEVLETRMLKNDKVQPDNYIYNLLIGACGQVGYTKKAFQLYKQMKERGLKVTGHTYTGLFNACANSPFPEDGLARACRLREILVEKAVLMNQTIYHAMIKAYGRCGDLETAFMLVDEMLEKRVNVTDETFNFLLQACVNDKSAGFRHALMVWRKMMEKRVKPSLFSFNLLLRTSRDCGLGAETAMQQMIQLLLESGQNKPKENTRLIEASTTNKMENSELAVTSTGDTMPSLIALQPTLGSVVSISNITLPEHRLMLMGGSKGVLELMKLFEIKPDIKTFTQLMDQLPATVEAEQELVEAMKDSRVPLDVDFCNMLIRKRCLRGDYENAKAVLKMIQEEDLRADIMTFGVLAMACQSAEAAQQLLEDIDNVGYRPNVEILGTLVKNACYSRDCKFVMKMMKTLEKEELKPNDKFLKHLDHFYRFASKTLSKQPTDNSRRLNVDQFKEYCEYYQNWRKEMRPDVLPHPWSQFQETQLQPDDIELMNYGKLKYAK